MEKIFFNDLDSIYRILLIGLLAYAGLIFLLKISGKRTLSKMNAFDLIITISLGSTLSASILNKSITLADGLFAMGLLIFLQFAITWTSVRSPFVSRMIKTEPSLLYFKGKFLESKMKKERITEEEALASIREAGFSGLEMVSAVIFETDGTISVIRLGGDFQCFK